VYMVVTTATSNDTKNCCCILFAPASLSPEGHER
jgi:hypothetical protein